MPRDSGRARLHSAVARAQQRLAKAPPQMSPRLSREASEGTNRASVQAWRPSSRTIRAASSMGLFSGVPRRYSTRSCTVLNAGMNPSSRTQSCPMASSKAVATAPPCARPGGPIAFCVKTKTPRRTGREPAPAPAAPRPAGLRHHSCRTTFTAAAPSSVAAPARPTSQCVDLPGTKSQMACPGGSAYTASRPARIPGKSPSMSARQRPRPASAMDWAVARAAGGHHPASVAGTRISTGAAPHACDTGTRRTSSHLCLKLGGAWPAAAMTHSHSTYTVCASSGWDSVQCTVASLALPVSAWRSSTFHSVQQSKRQTMSSGTKRLKATARDRVTRKTS
mmetsp:Transcript_109346/g.353013  ORF Transcript_109346/g.353013 Transcript_109346/m.353013 type:complete len:336 (+) Transcript_109346:184-1191(+)